MLEFDLPYCRNVTGKDLDLANRYISSLFSIYRDPPEQCVVVDDRAMAIVHYLIENKQSVSVTLFHIRPPEDIYEELRLLIEDVEFNEPIDIICTKKVKQEIERLASKWYEKDGQSFFTTDNSSLMVYSIL